MAVLAAMAALVGSVVWAAKRAVDPIPRSAVLAGTAATPGLQAEVRPVPTVLMGRL